MPLKWVGVVVAAVSVTFCATVNVLFTSLSDREVPIIINMAVITLAGVGTVLAVVAELFDRMNRRITALTEFLITRLNEIDTHAEDHNLGFVEGYLLSHRDASVVPIGSRGRGRQAMTANDD